MSTNISIHLPKEHIPQLREYYQNRLTSLQKELNEVSALLEQLESQVHTTTQVNGQGVLISPPVQISPGGYHPKWSLIKKAKFALKEAGRPLTSKEIVDLIIDNHDPAMRNERKRFMSSMSGTLSAHSKPGGIFKRQQNELEDFEYEVA
jgi:hypothetical protein